VVRERASDRVLARIPAEDDEGGTPSASFSDDESLLAITMDGGTAVLRISDGSVVANLEADTDFLPLTRIERDGTMWQVLGQSVLVRGADGNVRTFSLPWSAADDPVSLGLTSSEVLVTMGASMSGRGIWTAALSRATGAIEPAQVHAVPYAV